MYKEVVKYCEEHDVQLVAVSKTQANERIFEKYANGQIHFGENRVQELTKKYEELPKDIKWHLIGHLQTNKVKYIAPFVEMIHSVDSEKLLREINKEALKNDRRIDVLLQVHVAQEESKFGLDKDSFQSLLSLANTTSFPGVNLRGVMGMASFTSDMQLVRDEFKQIKAYHEYAVKAFPDMVKFDQISMGMSGDFKIAIEEGSTMIRVGSLIF